MSRFDRIVFDLDGTLVDSAPDLHAAANLMLGELGRPPLALEQIKSFVGKGVPKLVECCLDATGGVDGMHAEALQRFRHHYDAAPVELTRPFANAAETAAALRRAGFRLGICTNKPEAPARKVLAGLGMDSLFEVVVGGDTLPSQKPDPAPLRQALRALGGGEGSALFVGDSEVDAETAAGAGVAFALFSRGYRKRPIESFVAVVAFADFADLGAFLLPSVEE